MGDEEFNEDERSCLICGRRLSGYNKRDICFSHEIMPDSPQAKRLERLRARAKQAKSTNQAEPQ